MHTFSYIQLMHVSLQQGMVLQLFYPHTHVFTLFGEHTAEV